MLKWAVNSKRGEAQVPQRLSLEPSVGLDSGKRRSLAIPHQQNRRRSRRSLHNIDKENLDITGNTPAFSHKDILELRKSDFNSCALKDVSNLTPNSPTAKSPNVKNTTPNNRRSSGHNRKSLGNIATTPTSGLAKTLKTHQPAVKKRRIVLDTDIYIDEPESNKQSKQEIQTETKSIVEILPAASQYIKNKDKEVHSSQNDHVFKTKDIDEKNTKDIRYNIKKVFEEQQSLNLNNYCDTTAFEIEYSPLNPISNNCVKPIPSNVSTIPVIGSRIFINNPLYLKFNNNCANEDQAPPAKKSKIDFEDNFSRLINKLSPLSALKHHGAKERSKICSEVSPLARRMASLCFNRLNSGFSPESKETRFSNIISNTNHLNDRSRASVVKDDEFSIELETKTISDKASISDQSTITDSKMGDVTLERLIEDIIKSTKKVKKARKIKFQSADGALKCNNNTENIGYENLQKSDYQEQENTGTHSPALQEIPKSPLIVNNLSQSEVKTAVVKFIKDENNSKPSIVNEFHEIEKCLEPEKTYIFYDSLNSKEREVKTPDNRLSISMNAGVETMLRNCSLHTSVKNKTRLRTNSLQPTPKLSLSRINFNLKRQRCVRRKRQFNIKGSQDDIRLEYNADLKSSENGLLLNDGIPSPFTPEDQKLAHALESSSFNSITSYPFLLNTCDDVEFSNKISAHHHHISSPTLNSIHFGELKSPNTSVSSQQTMQSAIDQKSNSFKMFGLTLECGIPSPTSPYGVNRFLEDFHLETPGFCSSFMTDSSTQKCQDDSIDVISEPLTPCRDFKPTRRCLTFSPEENDPITPNLDKFNNPRSRLGLVQSQTSSGTIELIAELKEDQICVHIIKCRNLAKPDSSSSVNAYVKVNLSGMDMYQRTPVKRNCSSPTFDRRFVIPVPEKMGGRRIQVSVWHRDSQKRRSEFLGCVSFPLRHALRCSSNQFIAAGQYRLRASGNARRVSGPRPKDCNIMANTGAAQSSGTSNLLNNGSASNAAIDDQLFRDIEGASGIAARLAQGQREADEHLFLRYLELDPIEGPDAAPAAVQRKASGKAQGRTPFTTTRKLERGTDPGFGFSVLWTRPPRIERVDSGRAAERAGLYPGDYIVFVDRHNVVTMPESQVLNLIKNSGTTLVLETFRRPHPGEPRPQVSMSRLPRGSVTSHATLSDAAQYSPALLPKQLLTRLTGADSSSGQWKANRPSTACSNNTARSDAAATSTASKKRPALPQVAFTRESLSALTNQTSSGPRELGLALHAVVLREQHYAQALQFGVERYVVPLSSRTDILSPSEHKLLFQSCEEILRLSEDILEQLVSDDGEVSFHLIASVYLSKMPNIISLYKSYCNGLKRADCVLVQKSRQQDGAFTRLCTEPSIPSRKPDVTQFIHKPLEQFRELLRLLRAANSAVQLGHPDQRILAKLVNDLQNAYHDMTASVGIMGPIGEGRPLLSVADLESRLVFTRCKPFVLAKPGRQWIFGGDLVRVEGRSSRSHWGLLFSDLLLFATVSRDRVLFITEEPLLIANIAETCFNVRKRPTEFRIGIGNGRAGSPTARCGPPVRTRSRTLILRAPTTDLKAVWQTLLLRQILRVNSVTGTPLSSPMESPAPLACYSEVTLDSQLQHQLPPSSNTPKQRNQPATAESSTTRPRSSSCKGAALHLARWMKTHPGSVGSGGDLMEEPEPEIWSTEQLKKRSQELKLLDRMAQPTTNSLQFEPNKSPSENERSPSRSTNSDSQITVRSSPVVPETVSVCRQCHKRCFSKPNSPQISSKTLSPCGEKIKSATNNNSNGYLTVNHICSKNHIPETKIDFISRCAKENCIAETKITNSPIKSPIETSDKPNDKTNNSDNKMNHRVAIRKSREEFFRSTVNTKDICTSPLSRTSKSPSSQSPCSIKSSDSSRSTLYSTNSIMSFAQTTCSSSMALSKNTQSPERDSNASGSSGANREEAVQYVIAQEKYLNEVKCVENIVLKNTILPSTRFKDIRTYKNISRTFAETMNKSPENTCASSYKTTLNNALASDGNTINKFDNFSSTTTNIGNRTTGVGFLGRTRKITTMNGDIRKGNSNTNPNHFSSTENDVTERISTGINSTNKSATNFSWSPLMLMGLSSMSPAAHLLALDPEEGSNAAESTLDQLIKAPHTSPNRVPNIAVVPPTPDFKSDNKTMMSQHILEDSPDDSPVAEDLPYTALKRYGTVSSLEKLPSDELDDASFTGHQAIFEKDIQPQGLFSWTSRAGSYVAEKMALLNSLAESGAASSGASFLERYLGTGEWRAVRGSVGVAEGSGGEGSGASGEEAWGTPSSGDLSDHAFPDEDHATLSSPTKSSSSYPGDDDTELMMDELLMTPPIAGPSLRPLLPRRRLEPLLEEEGSETSSNSSAGTGSEITPSPTSKQESSKVERLGESVAVADVKSAARPLSVVNIILPLTKGMMVQRKTTLAAVRGMSDINQQKLHHQMLQRQQDDPELTPTNGPDNVSLLLSNVLHQSACARRASTPSSTTSDKTLPAEDEKSEHQLTTDGSDLAGPGEHGDSVGEAREGNRLVSQECTVGEEPIERLSPRMEMRLALLEGKDILAEQEQIWDHVQGHLGWVRRPIPRPCRLVTSSHIPQGHTITSHNSVSAQQEEVKVTAMERLAYMEARNFRRTVRRVRPTARFMGLVRRRASSSSPEHRPYSPRKQHQAHVSPDKQLDRRFWKQLRRRSCGSIRTYAEMDHLSLT